MDLVVQRLNRVVIASIIRVPGLIAEVVEARVRREQIVKSIPVRSLISIELGRD